MPSEQLTEELLFDIEQAVADGNDTNADIAKAIGWTEQKFRNWKDGKRKNGQEEKTRIDQAIRQGRGRRRKAILARSERLITQNLEDRIVTKTSKKYQHTFRVNPEGSDEHPVEPGIKGEWVKILIEEKEDSVLIKGDIALARWAAINCGEGKWVDTNRIEQKEPEEKEEAMYDLNKLSQDEFVEFMRLWNKVTGGGASE